MDKETLRARMAALGPVEAEPAAAVVEALFRHLSARLPGTCAAYLAMDDEVDVEPLFERLPGWRWVLPRVEPDGVLTFRDAAVERERHRWGMRQPVAAGPVIPVGELDVILVPGVGFDRGGERLGRGGGFYDRVLAVRRGDSEAIGVTVSERVVGQVPRLEHDQAVDLLATEAGVTRRLTSR